MPSNIPKYEILKQPGFYKVKIQGVTTADLFQNSLSAIKEGLNPFLDERPVKIFNTVKISGAEGITQLLDEFIENILFLSKTNMEIYEKAEFSSFTDNGLEARLEGKKAYSLKTEIKPAAPGNLTVNQRTDGLWEAVIAFGN